MDVIESEQGWLNVVNHTYIIKTFLFRLYNIRLE